VPDQGRGVLGHRELVGLEDRQLAGFGRDFRGELAGDPELAAAFGDQRRQVERDFAVGRGGKVFSSSPWTSTLANSSSARHPESWVLISSLRRSLPLVSTQLSVFSACRLTQIEKMARSVWISRLRPSVAQGRPPIITLFR